MVVFGIASKPTGLMSDSDRIHVNKRAYPVVFELRSEMPEGSVYGERKEQIDLLVGESIPPESGFSQK